MFVLITVLIGTICVILLSDKLHGLSSSSNERWYSETPVGKFLVKLTKRSEPVLDSDEKSRNICILQNPSENDLSLLRKNVFNTQREIKRNGSVVCYVDVRCESLKAHVSVDCSSRACSTVSLIFKDTNIKKSRLDMQMLAEIVEVMDDLGTAGIGEKLLLSCDDRAESGRTLTKLYLEYTGDRHCVSSAEKTRSSLNINIFFFRFLSRQSLMAKMTSLMDAVAKDRTSEMIDFQKFQSTQWKFTKSVSELLQGLEVFNVSKTSLLTLAQEMGFQVELLDTFIERSHIHEDFLKLIAKQLNESDIHKLNSNYSHIKCCFDSCNAESDLRTRFKNYKACFVEKESSYQVSPTFRLSFLNYIDFSSDVAIVDTQLSDIVKLLSKQQNSITIFMSDVGDPTYTTLASSLFLQTEASNPFLFICLPRRLLEHVPNFVLQTARSNTKRLLAMRDVHETIKDIIYLVSGNDENAASTKKRAKGIGRSLFTARDDSLTCASLIINPPGLCLCEGQFSVYPNDTLQAGFAEVALGVINNRILKYASEQLGYNAYDLPPLLRGKSFSKVHIRNFRNTQQRVMDIIYSAENSEKIDTIFNVSVTFDPVVKTCAVGVLGRTEVIDDAFVEAHFSSVIGRFSRLYSPLKLSTSSKSSSLSSKHFGMPTRKINIHQNCLILLKTDFMDSATFEIANACSDRKYHFRFDSNLLDAVSLIALPIYVALRPGDFRFLTSFVKSSYLVHHGMFHYETDFDVIYL